MIGDILVHPTTRELYVIASVGKGSIKVRVYETGKFKLAREDQIIFGPNCFEYFKDLVPVHEVCEVRLRSWMLHGLFQQLTSAQNQLKSLQGFLDHIAGLLRMNGSSPEDMRVRIIDLIRKSK